MTQQTTRPTRISKQTETSTLTQTSSMPPSLTRQAKTQTRRTSKKAGGPNTPGTRRSTTYQRDSSIPFRRTCSRTSPWIMSYRVRTGKVQGLTKMTKMRTSRSRSIQGMVVTRNTCRPGTESQDSSSPLTCLSFQVSIRLK